jgi:predicted transcriptional regulator
MESLSSLSLSSGSFAGRLMSVNLSLVLFNLLPAFPMDGGRVVRSLLALRMDYSRATHIAATLGQGMAFLFGLAGLFSNPMLLFIAFFVYIGAAQEASMVQMKTALGGIPVERAMMTNFQILNPRDPLGRATQLILEGYQQDFPVVDDGSVVGVLMRADLLAALSQRGQNVPVADVMKRKFEVVDSSDMLEASLARLQGSDIHTMPVYHNGLLVGMLTTENIGEFLLIQAALGTKKKPQVGYSL